MGWSYSGDPSNSDLDAVRFYLQDTVAADPFMNDEEIQFLLDAWMTTFNDPIMIAAMCAETLANRFARELDVSGDGVSISAGQLMERFQAVALNLRAQFKTNAGAQAFVEDFSGALRPTSGIAPLWAAIGQHDNPENGQAQEGIYGHLPAFDPFDTESNYP